MPSEPEQSVLRRMVAPPRQSPTQQGGDAEDAHIKVRLPRDADQLLGLAVEVTSVSRKRLSQEDVVASVQTTDLIYALVGTGGAMGLAVVDCGLLAALIEVQTTGRVAPRPPAERTPSRTDGIVASDIVDRWLEAVCPVEGDGSPSQLHEAHRQDRLLDPRAVSLALDPGAYEVLKVTMSLGDGAKTGVLSFLLPAEVATRSPSGWASAGSLAPREVIGSLRTELAVEMVCFPIPLTELFALTVGSLLPVPSDRLGRATLKGLDGSAVARVSLGQMSGQWAIRLTDATGRSLAGGVAQSDFPPLAARAGPKSVEPGQEGWSDTDRDIDPTLTDLPDIDTGGALPELPDLPDLPALVDHGPSDLT